MILELATADRVPANDPIAVSVVVPAQDEAPNLVRLVAEVRASLDPLGIAWELIVVDDGSDDDTPALLARLAEAEHRLRPLRLARRGGQTAALVAGFRAARGRLIATLDADLQCAPAELPRLLAALEQADLACGVRAHRNDPRSRRLASALANLGRRLLFAPRVRDLACPLRVFRAEALARVEEEIPLFDGAHRWLPALFTLAGQRVVQRPVTHHPRTAGESKYTTRGRVVPIACELVRLLALAARRSPARRAVLGLALLALAAFPFVYALGRWPLIEPDEGRNAEVAREMLALGQWSVPHLNGLPYLDKPVLLFWMIAGAFRVLGVSELAARLPSVLGALA
ncbi:MAG TPA: glycosyltransferase, partial [Candidatus Elarobacter sp.]|nr:glycosyltransferase [Candidatus Elarobacter sp.]